VIVTGIWNEAPWQPLAELVLIAAPLGMWMMVVPAGTLMLSEDCVGTETPELALVQRLPPTTVTVDPISEMLVRVTAKLFGLLRVNVRSALAPGMRSDDGVPVAASTVTDWAVPVMAVPEPFPELVK
jgi:hypothetical protein